MCVCTYVYFIRILITVGWKNIEEIPIKKKLITTCNVLNKSSLVWVKKYICTKTMTYWKLKNSVQLVFDLRQR